jgi:hypothetical protein
MLYRLSYGLNFLVFYLAFNVFRIVTKDIVDNR